MSCSSGSLGLAAGLVGAADAAVATSQGARQAVHAVRVAAVGAHVVPGARFIAVVFAATALRKRRGQPPEEKNGHDDGRQHRFVGLWSLKRLLAVLRTTKAVLHIAAESTKKCRRGGQRANESGSRFEYANLVAAPRCDGPSYVCGRGLTAI